MNNKLGKRVHDDETIAAAFVKAMTLQPAVGTTSSSPRRVIPRSFNASLLGICGLVALI